MSYTKHIYDLGNAIEVEEKHTYRLRSPGMKREKKKKLTPAQMKAVNQKNKEKKCRRRLRKHFRENDYFVCLTYKIEERPSNMAEAGKDFSDALRKIRKAYAKAGYKVKWIRNIEVGTRNAWHIHLVINRIPDTDLILRKAWKKGKVICQLMYEKGEFKDLAAYLTKTPETDKRLRESEHDASRNLPLPEPEKKRTCTGKLGTRFVCPKATT